MSSLMVELTAAAQAVGASAQVTAGSLASRVLPLVIAAIAGAVVGSLVQRALDSSDRKRKRENEARRAAQKKWQGEHDDGLRLLNALDVNVIKMRESGSYERADFKGAGLDQQAVEAETLARRCPEPLRRPFMEVAQALRALAQTAVDLSAGPSPVNRAVEEVRADAVKQERARVALDECVKRARQALLDAWGE